MLKHSGVIAAAAFALVLAAGPPISAADEKAGKGWVQGKVTDENGKPLSGAEIRAQRVDTHSLTGVTLTDSKGRYLFKKLPIGAYSITAYVDGTPVSRANVQTRADGWAKVDFDLRLNAKGNDGTDRMQRDLRMSPTSPLAAGRASF